MFETETFRLHVVERPDPAEVLGWMGEGLVRLRLPLPERRIQLGPIAWSLDSTAVLEVRVAEGEIDRSSARGHLDPPVRLPLGFEVERLRLSPQGDVILGSTGLPDINLSALIPWLPRIPTRLRELGEQLARRAREERAQAKASGPHGRDGHAAAPRSRSGDPHAPPRSPRPGLEVDARSVRPLPGVVMDLGPAGRLELSPDSELDLRYAERKLTCRGTLIVGGGELKGPKFHADGLRSTGRMDWERKRRFELTDLAVRADHLQWSHEDREWRLVDVELQSDHVVYTRAGEDISLEGALQITGHPDPAYAPDAPADERVTLTVELEGAGIGRVT